MTSTRPYLIRALYEWIVDNQCTPHLLVEVKDDQTRVPRQFVDKGVIVLNVAPSAVKHLLLGNDRISFSARFGGTPHDIDVPVSAVQAIYAHHVLHGLASFEEVAPPLEEMRRRFEDITTQGFPYLVAEEKGEILGYVGPNGSGKTTTLYSTLKQLATPEVNVCTIEDPIEMVVPCFNQMQVQHNIQLDFASAGFDAFRGNTFNRRITGINLPATTSQQ